MNMGFLQAYGIHQGQSTTVKTLELIKSGRVHLTMVDMLRTTVFEGEHWNEDGYQALQAISCVI